jgi:hypothetical protein
MNKEEEDDFDDDDEDDDEVIGAGSSADAVLVDSGSFSIDRGRALRKLMRFQLPDPGMYLLLIVRCAVASGAKSLSLSITGRGGLQAVFDGEPFTAEELEYPYASLFKRSRKRRRRNRQLAVALLSLLRLSPRNIVLTSGIGKERVQLTLSSLDSENLERVQDGQKLTFLSAVRGKKALLTSAYTAMLKRCCRLSPIPITLNGERLPRRLRSTDPDEYSFSKEGVRGWISLPKAVSSTSSLDLYRYGVFLSNVRRTLAEVQVDGGINHDRLTANASQSGVVRNSRLDHTVAMVRQASFELLKKLAANNSVELIKTARHLQDPGAARHWRHRLENGFNEDGLGLLDRISRFATKFASNPGASERNTHLDSVLRRTLWLRKAADTVLKDHKDKKQTAEAQAVWNAGLYLDVNGFSLSLAELHEQHKLLGHTPYATQLFPAVKVGFRVLWVASPLELEPLRSWLGNGFNDVHALLVRRAREQAAGPFRAGNNATLAQLGLTSASKLIHTRFEQAPYLGEVALPVNRLKEGARVHLFENNNPSAYVNLPGALRFQAALAGASSQGGQALQPAIRVITEAAATLYRRLGEEYEPGRGLQRDEYIRQHLLDYLIWTIAGGEKRLDAERWIVLARIFRAGDSFWNYERLRENFDRGMTLFFTSTAERPGHIAPLFNDALYQEKFLRALFPHCGIGSMPGESALHLVFRRLQKKPHADCLLAWEINGETVYLAPGPKGGATLRKSPWGTIRIYHKSKDIEIPSLPDQAYYALIEAVLRELGGMAEDTDNPAREFLISALTRLFNRYNTDHSAHPDAARLIEFAIRIPLFVRGSRIDSLHDFGVRIRLSGGLGRSRMSVTSNKSLPRFTRSRKELAMLKILWPDLYGKPRKKRKKKKPPPPRRVRIADEGSSKPAPEALPAAALEAGLDPVLARLRGLFAQLRGRRGIDFSGTPKADEIGAQWLRRHPRAKWVLESSLANDLKADYLASMLYTQANRRINNVTDKDDIYFQQALLERLTHSKGGKK